jgi:hypothetical protein
LIFFLEGHSATIPPLIVHRHDCPESQLIFPGNSENLLRGTYIMSRTSLQKLRFVLAGIASFTWLLPLQAVASDPSAMPRNTAHTTPLIRDVALGPGGRITGQFVNAQGHPQANQLVVLQREGGKVLQLKTDVSGRFALTGMTGGLYQFATVDSGMVCRCWAERTAPPNAIRDVLLVSGEGIQRGQRPISELLFSGPVLVALVIAAAIAIPIAVHNSQDAS